MKKQLIKQTQDPGSHALCKEASLACRNAGSWLAYKSCIQIEPFVVQVTALGDRVTASEDAADQAEEDASVAMRSAETGVREEMEAASVVKQTESALSKALAELTFLETSYEEKEFESYADKAKAKEKAQKEAEAAVKNALASVNATVQTPDNNGATGELTGAICVCSEIRYG